MKKTNQTNTMKVTGTHKLDELAWLVKKDKKQTKLEEYKMEIEITEMKVVEDGKHVGKIVDFARRTKPFDYLDLIIEESKTGMRLKYGISATLNPSTALGKLVLAFGGTIPAPVKGEKVTMKLDEVFLNKAVEFMTLTAKTERGSFANIVKGSLRLIE